MKFKATKRQITAQVKRSQEREVFSEIKASDVVYETIADGVARYLKNGSWSDKELMQFKRIIEARLR